MRNRGLTHTTLNPAAGLKPRRERHHYRRRLRALLPRLDLFHGPSGWR